MVKEKVIEYETVEREEEITVCDQCGKTEKESNAMIDVRINPIIDKKESEEIIPIQTFDDKTEMFQEYQKYQRKKPPYMDSFSYGIGKRRTTRIKDLQCTAKQDMCLSCAEEFFDIDIPKDEVVNDVEFKKENMIINTTKEVTTIWPNFIKIFNEDWGEAGEVIEMGWFGKIVFWPLDIFATIIEYDTSWSNVERQKGYMAASIGSILWFSVAILIYLFIL